MNEKEISVAIEDAVGAGDIERVRSLIGKSKERLHEMTPFGTWLHIAAEAGATEVVEWLISKGINVNLRGGIAGGAPVDLAAGAGELEIVQVLLVAGAELDVSEPERNPLFSAIYGGHLLMVQLLVYEGIDYRVRYTGKTMKNLDAEDFARERGETEIAEYLAGLKA